MAQQKVYRYVPGLRGPSLDRNWDRDESIPCESMRRRCLSLSCPFLPSRSYEPHLVEIVVAVVAAVDDVGTPLRSDSFLQD